MFTYIITKEDNMKQLKSGSLHVLLILSLTAGLMYLIPFMRFSFYDQMRLALGLNDMQMGIVGSVYGALNVICYIPSGFLADKFSAKKLLLVSTMGMCLCTLWYASFPGFAALLVIHALYGIFSVGTFWCPYLKAVRALAPEEGQSAVFGMSEGLRGLGQAAVAFLCLAIMQQFAAASGFRALVLINAAAFALMFAATLFLVPDERAVAASGESVAEALAKMLACLKDSGIWICITLIMCGYTIWNTVNGYIGTYTTRVLELPPAVSSILSIVRNYIIVLLAELSGGFLLDRFRTRGAGMMLAFSLCALCGAAMLIAEHLVALCAGLTILLGYFVNVVKSTYWSILGDAGIPPEATGRATGVISLIALSPDFFVPPIVSAMISSGEAAGDVSGGFHMMLVWLIGWALLGIAAAFALRRRKLRLKKT
jgi:predicted MFS family arabinose efflux permease